MSSSLTSSGRSDINARVTEPILSCSPVKRRFSAIALSFNINGLVVLTLRTTNPLSLCSITQCLREINGSRRFRSASPDRPMTSLGSLSGNILLSPEADVQTSRGPMAFSSVCFKTDCNHHKAEDYIRTVHNSCTLTKIGIFQNKIYRCCHSH